MRFTIFLLLFAFYCVQGKNYVKTFTESMGQEIIEVGHPIKELPPGLDEEPSAEVDDEEISTIMPVQPIAKRDRERTTETPLTTSQKKSDDSTTMTLSSEEEEESRIEKELGDIYKDTDYKSEPNKEILKKPLATEKVIDQPVARASIDYRPKPNKEVLRKPLPMEKGIDKPIARQKTNFQFQPNIDDRQEVARFRTSIDEISCEKRATQRLKDIVALQAQPKNKVGQELVNGEELKETSTENAVMQLQKNIIVLSLAFLMGFVCQ